LRLWGNWGPQSPKQKKNASVWQAKIKAAKTLNHKPACNAGGTQSSPKAMSAGELKENKKPLLEATRRPEGRGLASNSQSRKKRFVIFWWLCRIPQYLLPDKFT
jgi:hypothetical protein